MRNASLLVGIMLLLPCAGCGGSGGSSPGDDVPAGDDGRGSDAVAPLDVPPGTDTLPSCETGGSLVCCQGETNGCTPDQQGIYACTEDGTGWVSQPCQNDAGEATICLSGAGNPEGYCTLCKPGQRTCKDDDIILICNEQGTEWQEYQDCAGATSGQICQQGTCVKLCEINIKQNMYMGCDFWAVDLDNAFVPGGRTGFYDAAGSQYSVVVSNPSTKYPATVSISGIEGEVLFDSDDNPFPTTPLQPGQLRIYNLPRRDADGTVLAPLAYRVRSSIPITAYQFNPLQNVEVFSNDASLLMPENVMGKYYIVMTREQTFYELRSYFTVVAIREGTTIVTVDVTAPTLVGTNER
ncbi:MAG: IgGFc-binding protein, partial [Deltaproteobacteria bacterium]|nr:IgGFc-binding protein [Deltaproteobacteria bacterium]